MFIMIYQIPIDYKAEHFRFNIDRVYTILHLPTADRTYSMIHNQIIHVIYKYLPTSMYNVPNQTVQWLEYSEKVATLNKHPEAKKAKR